MTPEIEKRRSEFEAFDMTTVLIDKDDYDIRQTYYIAGRKKGEEDLLKMQEGYIRELSGLEGVLGKKNDEITQLKKQLEQYEGYTTETEMECLKKGKGVIFLPYRIGDTCRKITITVEAEG